MPIHTSSILRAALLALLGTLPLGARAQAVSSFDLPAQPLVDSLRAIASQSNSNVFFEPQIIAGKQARELKVSATVEEALAKLLEGTGLTYTHSDDNTIRIVLVEHKKSSTAGVIGSSELRLAQADMSARQQTVESPESSESWKLEEIVVTATKRSQSIQDVPLSITAITADEIDRRGLVSAEDYLRGVPGVNQMGEQLGQTIVIRGIETTPRAQNFSTGTTVATYFGETPTTNTAGIGGGTNIDLKLVDIDRVEVLRGPQGTAFGNSSLGGAVRTIPTRPKVDRFEGRVSANYSVTSGSGGDNTMLQAVGNVPLIEDKLALRAAAYRFEDSGFYRNVAGSDADFQAAAASWGAQAFAIDSEEIGSSSFKGGRIAALFRPTDAIGFTFSYVTQKTETDDAAIVNAPGAFDQVVLQVAPEHVMRGQRGGLLDTKIDLANVTMEYDLKWASLLVTFSHIESGVKSAAPLANFLALPTALPLSDRGMGNHEEKSGEIRLATQLEGRWNFLAGLYAEELEDDFSEDLYWFGSPGTNIFGTDRFLGVLRDRRNLEQQAAFAEAAWMILPGLTFTGGVRAYDYERTGRVDNSALTGGEVIVTETAAEASGTTFRGTLSYQATENTLVYAGWSQGFRLGTPQPGLSPDTCDRNGDDIVDGTEGTTIDSTRAVDSDEVDNYELGAKLTLAERRLMIAADVFRIDWSGLPFRVLAPAPPVGCGFAYNANAGEARSQGIELQVSFSLTEAFRVDLGASRINAELTKDAPGLLPPAFDEDRLPGSPKFNANLGMQYRFAVLGYEAFARADSIYVGPFYGDLRQSEQTRSGDYLKIDASVRVAIRNLSVDLFVRNLTKEDAFTFRGIGGLGDFYGYRLRPRTFGVQLGYDF